MELKRKVKYCHYNSVQCFLPHQFRLLILTKKKICYIGNGFHLNGKQTYGSYFGIFRHTFANEKLKRNHR